MDRDQLLPGAGRHDEGRASSLLSSLAAEKKVVAAIKALPPSEREVVVYGERVWPAVNSTYDYEQLCCAVWSFQDLNRWFSQTLSGQDIGSRAQIIRLTTKWMQEYLNRALPGESGSKVRKVYLLIDTLTRAMVRNPNGECRIPPHPVIEGQW